MVSAHPRARLVLSRAPTGPRRASGLHRGAQGNRDRQGTGPVTIHRRALAGWARADPEVSAETGPAPDSTHRCVVVAWRKSLVDKLTSRLEPSLYVNQSIAIA